MPSWKKLIVSGSDATLNDITLSGDLSIPVDSKKIQVGAGNDLAMYHNGSHSYIDHTGTGNLYIRNTTDDKNIIIQTDDASGGVTDYMRFKGDENLIRVDKALRMQDSVQLQLGSGADFDMFHDGTNMTIREETGDLTIKNTANDKDIILQSDDGSGGTTAYLTLDGSTTTVEVAKNLNVSANISGSQIEASGDVIAFGSSDERLKDNIQPITEPLWKVSQIGGYTFDWNDNQDTYEGHDVGVVAQEIHKVLPEVVAERSNGYLGVKYEKIVPLLIESIKELDKKIKHIEKNCDCLNN